MKKDIIKVATEYLDQVSGGRSSLRILATEACRAANKVFPRKIGLNKAQGRLGRETLDIRKMTKILRKRT